MTDDLNADYQAAGFGGRLAFGLRPALLVIDVVEAYLRKDSPLYAGVEDARDSNIRLVDGARCAGVPVIFTNVTYNAGGADGGVFFRKVPSLKVFLPGSPLGAFPGGLQPRADELVVSKQYPSAFFGTSIANSSCSISMIFAPGASLSSISCRRIMALFDMSAEVPWTL